METEGVKMALLKSDAIIVFFIIASGILIRVIGIDSQGLWFDEGLTISISKWPTIDMILLPTDPTPFLYYFLHKVFISPDYSAGAVRYLSLFFGVTSIPVMYILGRMCLGRQAGLMASALLAVWTIHVDYSQEARAYALLFLFTLLSSVGVVGYTKTIARNGLRQSKESSLKRILFLAVFTVGSVGSFYTHIISVFWIAITISILFMAIKTTHSRYQVEILICFVAIGVLLLPGLYWLYMRVYTPHSFNWNSQRGPLSALSETTAIFLPTGLWKNFFTQSKGIVEIVQALVFLSAVGASILSIYWRRLWIFSTLKSQPIVIYLIIGYISIPLIIWLLGFIMQPIFMTRTILLAAPGSILIISWLCSDRKRRVYPAPAAIILALFFTSTVLYGFMREKNDWRDATEYLASVIKPNDAIYICGGSYSAIRHNIPRPLGASVLINSPTVEGQLVLIERGLGHNPLWDSSSFQNIILPGFKKLTGLSPLTAKSSTRKKPLLITLEEGDSVWIFERHCYDSIKVSILVALNTATSELSTSWASTPDNQDLVPLFIKRYKVDKQTTIKVIDGIM